MKRAAAIFGMLAVSSLLAAQQQQPAPTQSNQPAQGATQSGASATAPPPGKRPPQAKTQPEFDAYNAVANQKDPAALEKAADDFAAKFPESELRALLYKASMRGYQNANNGDKMAEMAQKLLKLDPDD